MICGQQFLCHVSDILEAEITVINPPENKVVSNGFPAIIHLHTIQEDVMIKKVISNLTTGANKGLICLRPGDRGVVRIHTETPICVEKFDEFPEIAKFSLRAESS